MRLLVDTNVLIWAAEGSPRLPAAAADMLLDPKHDLWFSVLAVAEVAVKFARGRPDFQVDPLVFRQALLSDGYGELLLTGAHVVRLADLPPIHKDPFDRLLIAQAMAEGVTLVTADATLGRYGPRVLVV